MADTTIDVSRFRFNVLSKRSHEMVPVCADCDYETESATEGGPKRFAQYEIGDLNSIWCRVVCRNVNPNNKFEDSLLGPEGHIERMNVWTHLAAAGIYFLHLVIRPTYTDSRQSTTNSLVSLDSGALIVTFVISSAYHVYSANYFWSAVTRLGDYAGIYLSIATGYIVDLSISTNNLAGVPWQAVADVWIAMAFMVAFFVVRRIVTPISETRLAYLEDRCSLGLARNTNVDLEHSSLRAAAGVVMAFSWILTIPGGFVVLEQDCELAFFLSHIIGTVILVAGMALDNVFLYPDVWFKKKGTPPTRCVCYNSKAGCGGGWIMTSHALWHIISVFATLSTTIGLEYVILNSDVLLQN
jgi:hypothetical protein